jgi:hypothetical protein
MPVLLLIVSQALAWSSAAQFAQSPLAVEWTYATGREGLENEGIQVGHLRRASVFFRAAFAVPSEVLPVDCRLKQSCN